MSEIDYTEVLKVAQSVDGPVPTLTTMGANVGVAEASFVLGQHSTAAARLTGEPLPTIVSDGAISLINPKVMMAAAMVLPVTHGGGPERVDSATCSSPTTGTIPRMPAAP